MRVKVRQIHEQGRPLRGVLREAAPVYTGVLTLSEECSQELHRTLLKARIVGRTDATQQPILPDLVDATVRAIRGSSLRIRGFEVVNGQHFGQVWEVEVLPC